MTIGPADEAVEHGLVEDRPELQRRLPGEEGLALHARLDTVLNLLLAGEGQDAAAAHHAGDDAHALTRLADLPEPAPPAAPEPTAAEIRAWARTAGLDISNGGRIPVEIRAAYHQAHQR